MAEDREAFRDLLDRIGQPYAPSAIVEGRRRRPVTASADEALAEIGLPAIIRPAFTLGGTGGGIVETEPAYRERIRAGPPGEPDRPGHGRALPRRLAGDRVRGHARRRRHVHRRVLHGERRPAGRPHRRLDRRRAGPDADRRRSTSACAAPPSRSSGRSASRAAATSSSRSRRTRPSTPSSRSTRASRARPPSPRRRPATRSPGSRPRSRSGAGSPRSRTS